MEPTASAFSTARLPRSRRPLIRELLRGYGWFPSTQRVRPHCPWRCSWRLGGDAGHLPARGRPVCGGGLVLWARGTEPTGPCSCCRGPSWLSSAFRPPARPSSRLVSVVTVSPTPPFCVACPTVDLLEDQVPGLFIRLSFPGFVRGKRVSSLRPRRAEGLEGADSSCRNQAGLGSGPWEKQSVHSLCPSQQLWLLSPPLSEWMGSAWLGGGGGCTPFPCPRLQLAVLCSLARGTGLQAVCR